MTNHTKNIPDDELNFIKDTNTRGAYGYTLEDLKRLAGEQYNSKRDDYPEDFRVNPVVLRELARYYIQDWKN
jgi:hypothetical protein